jgi:phosphohistidine phosphatase
MHLHIIRHGKAERDSASGQDADRPLARRGRDQAEYLGELLEAAVEKHARRPALLISSRALRARATADIIARRLGLAPEFDDRLLVDEPLSGALALVAELFSAASAACVVLVGHNPQLERLGAVVHGRKERGLDPLRTGECVACEITDADGVSVQGRVLTRFRLEKDD